MGNFIRAVAVGVTCGVVAYGLIRGIQAIENRQSKSK